MKIGVARPGSIGASLATALSGHHEVLWSSDGRSSATTNRARSANLTEVRDLGELAARSDVIVSICPPNAAIDVAEQVSQVRTSGLLYIDANTIAPETVRRVADMFEPGAVVDAAVTGSPRLDLGATVLWLFGPGATGAVGLFAGSSVSTRIVGTEIGQASAFKTCAGLRSKVIPAVWATLIDTAKAFEPEVEESVRGHLADIGHDMSEHEAKIAEHTPKGMALDRRGWPNQPRRWPRWACQPAFRR